jgi:hypothetical protein
MATSPEARTTWRQNWLYRGRSRAPGVTATVKVQRGKGSSSERTEHMSASAGRRKQQQCCERWKGGTEERPGMVGKPEREAEWKPGNGWKLRIGSVGTAGEQSSVGRARKRSQSACAEASRRKRRSVEVREGCDRARGIADASTGANSAASSAADGGNRVRKRTAETAERTPEGQGNLSGGWSAPLLRVASAATEAAQWKADTNLVDAAQASARLRRCVPQKHGLNWTCGSGAWTGCCEAGSHRAGSASERATRPVRGIVSDDERRWT